MNVKTLFPTFNWSDKNISLIFKFLDDYKLVQLRKYQYIRNFKQLFFSKEKNILYILIFCAVAIELDRFPKILTKELMLIKYPYFNHLDNIEFNYLFLFWKSAYIMANILNIPWNCGKKMYLNICSKFEENDRKYITGGGQTVKVKNRIFLCINELNLNKI